MREVTNIASSLLFLSLIIHGYNSLEYFPPKVISLIASGGLILNIIGSLLCIISDLIDKLQRKNKKESL